MPEPFARSGANPAGPESPGSLSLEENAARPYERRLDPVASVDDLDNELVHEFVKRSPLRGRLFGEALEHYGLAEWCSRIEGSPE